MDPAAQFLQSFRKCLSFRGDPCAVIRKRSIEYAEQIPVRIFISQ